MKKIFFLTTLLLIGTFLYAQFGGGSGTESNPYSLSTKEHFEELADSVMAGNTYAGVYFKLMNNIDDSVSTPISTNSKSFNGYFQGCGYNIALAINNGSYSLFPNLGLGGTVDSLSVTGYIYAVHGIVGNNHGIVSNVINNLTVPYTQMEFSQYIESMGDFIEGAGICYQNYGTIENCTNYCEIHGTILGGICCRNIGVIQNCINKGILTMYNISDQYSCTGGGICAENISLEGGIDNCKNYADIVFISNSNIYCIGGIVGINSTKIINSSNFGNISGKVYELGGCIGCFYGGEILNCSNHGNISGELSISGIGGLAGDNIMQNCFNSGNISGDSLVGGISAYTSASDTISRCLNIGRTNGAAVVGSLYQAAIQPTELFFNYYDKQMCLSKGIGDSDVPGSAEGKLTTQLTGTSQALQAMLGDGWSYAEGRYPIPLGLENDSMALVAATPVYLYTENENSYNHVDSVSKNFTVGLENNVNWNATNERVSFSDENVTLLSMGVENLKVSLGNYSKIVRINIVDTEVANPQQTFENEISVYPNPANENITINLNNSKADKLEISDITGKIVFSSNAIKVNQILNISHLKQGIYMLRLIKNENIVFTEKFIKQK